MDDFELVDWTNSKVQEALLSCTKAFEQGALAAEARAQAETAQREVDSARFSESLSGLPSVEHVEQDDLLVYEALERALCCAADTAAASVPFKEDRVEEAAYLCEADAALTSFSKIDRSLRAGRWEEAISYCCGLHASIRQQTSSHLDAAVREFLIDVLASRPMLRSWLQHEALSALEAMHWPRCDGLVFGDTADRKSATFWDSTAKLVALQSIVVHCEKEVPLSLWAIDSLLIPVKHHSGRGSGDKHTHCVAVSRCTLDFASILKEPKIRTKAIDRNGNLLMYFSFLSVSLIHTLFSPYHLSFSPGPSTIICRRCCLTERH